MRTLPWYCNCVMCSQVAAIFGREFWSDLKAEDQAIGHCSAVHCICRDLPSLIDVNKDTPNRGVPKIETNHVPNTE